MQKVFKFFQTTRALSSTGDEMWLSMLPVYFASISLSAAEVGWVFSTGAVGSLLGFIVLPLIGNRIKASHVALSADLCQSVVVVLIIISLFGHFENAVVVWSCIHLLSSFLSSLWYCASETLITRISDKDDSQNTHRWNYFAGSVGPAAGPAIGGIVYQAMGMLAIVLINAVSFVLQAFALLSLGKFERQEIAEKQNVRAGLLNGMGSVWSDERLRYMTLMPIVVKIFLLGAIPFVAFKLTHASTSSFLVGMFFAVFAVGNLAGALFYRAANFEKLASQYRTDSALLLLSGLALNVALFYTDGIVFVSLAAFCAGVFIARYSIELRSLRQKIVSSNRMATVISSQGFLARLATPLAGIIYGYLLTAPNDLAIAALLLAFGLLGAVGVFGTYVAFQKVRV